MSQMGIYRVSGATGVFELTGNTGGSVGPLGGNINIVGAGTVTVDGDPATHTLTITGSGGGLTEFAVVVGNHAGNSSSLATVGLTGQTLMGNTGANPSWTGSPSFSGTVTAGTGLTVTTGNASITDGNLNLPTTTAIAGIINVNAVKFIHSYGTNNTFIGESAGNFTLTVANAVDNVGIGKNALKSLAGTTAIHGHRNTAVGSNSSTSMLEGYDNCSCGYYSLSQVTSGIRNCAFGSRTLQTAKGGSLTAIGCNAGSAYTGTESSNILIGSTVTGVLGENNVLRIGNATGVGVGNLNDAYIAGIYGKAVGATSGVTLTDSVDKLGTISGAAGTILIGGTSPSFLPVGVAGQVLSTQGAGSDPHWIDQMAVAGMTEFAVIVGNHTGGVASLGSVGLNGQTLMGNTGANPIWTSSPQFGGSVTALYDISTTAGNLVTLQGNIRAVNSELNINSSILVFEKSRGAAVLATGDVLGRMKFTGYDGTHLIPGAKIVSTSSGTIAAGRVAGNLEFYTHPDSVIAFPSEPLLRMSINSAGNVTVANPDAGTALTITNGGLTVSAGTTTLSALASTAATGVLTVSNAGVLAEVETGAAGTVFVGTAGSPKFLAAGNAGQILASQGAGSDPHWIDNNNIAFCAYQITTYDNGSTTNAVTYVFGTGEPFITVPASHGFPNPKPAYWTEGGAGNPCSFTAPVNGIYTFTLNAYIYDSYTVSNSNYMLISMLINGNASQTSKTLFNISTSTNSCSKSFISNLLANDVVTFSLYRPAVSPAATIKVNPNADDVSTFIFGYQIA